MHQHATALPPEMGQGGHRLVGLAEQGDLQDTLELLSASVCQARGRLGAADGAGHTVMFCWSADLSPGGI